MLKIYFDLDGTLYDLYGLPNWLDKLRSETPGAFLESFPLFGEDFYKIVSKLLAKGVKFGVITWLPMGASEEYEEICAAEKKEWCKNYLPFIETFAAQTYGVPKQKAITKRAATEILIDDNLEICRTWQTEKRRKYENVDEAYTVSNALADIYYEYFGED